MCLCNNAAVISRSISLKGEELTSGSLPASDSYEGQHGPGIHSRMHGVLSAEVEENVVSPFYSHV